MRAAPARIAYIDALRAAAVIMVVASHAGYSNIVPGSTGVTIFFVISGYIITTLLVREWDDSGAFSIGRFYAKRAFKILPPLAAVVLIPTAFFAFGHPISPREVASQVLFFFNFVYMSGEGHAVLPGSGVVWSLAIEEQFYIVFAVLWIIAIRRSNPEAILIGCSVLAVATALLRRMELQEAGVQPIRILYGTDTRIDSIAVGILVAVALRRIERGSGDRMRAAMAGNWPLAAALMLLALSAVLRFDTYKYTVRPLAESVAAALLVAFGALARTKVHTMSMTLAQIGPVQIVGLASYSIYLVHLVVFKNLMPEAFAPLKIVAGLLAGISVWLLVERPSLSIRRRVLGEATQNRVALNQFDSDQSRSTWTPAVAVATRSVSFGDGVGGMERAAGRHITGLLALNHAVILYAPTKHVHGRLPKGMSIVDVPWPIWDVLRPLTFGPAYLLWVKRLARELELRRARIGYVHVHGAAAGVLSFLDGRLPSAHNPHGLEEFGAPSLLRSWNRLFLRRMVRKGFLATVVISTDESVTNKIYAAIGARPEQIRVIPNAVGVEALEQVSRSVDPILADIVSIGRLSLNKGYDLLAQAIRLIERDAKTRVRWVHFGSGPERAKIERLALQPPSIDLHIMSSRPDAEVFSTLRRAGIFVQPSRDEGSSLTTLEAMALGKVVVATPVGGIPDKIEDGSNGYLAADVSAESLATAILRAASGRDTGPAARQTVIGRFSIEVESKLYSDLSTSLGAPPSSLGRPRDV